MPTQWEMNVEKQAIANAEQRADTEKYLWDRDHYMSEDERKEIERVQLYSLHEKLGSLGTYYAMYPSDKGARAYYAKQYRYQYGGKESENEDEYER